MEIFKIKYIWRSGWMFMVLKNKQRLKEKWTVQVITAQNQQDGAERQIWYGKVQRFKEWQKGFKVQHFTCSANHGIVSRKKLIPKKETYSSQDDLISRSWNRISTAKGTK